MTSHAPPDPLHVTNGDVAADRIRASGIAGEVLPWRDVLHEGPVPGGFSLEDLSAVRAACIAGRGWGEYEEVRAGFAARDRRLAHAVEEGETTLWFEHDLYDQLQLIQLLDALAGPVSGGRVGLVCIGEHPGLERFHGLGQLSPGQIAALYPRRARVSAAEVEVGRAAWAAFRAPDPSRLQRLVDGDTFALPFLRAALVRHLEQFPAVGDGLSRTERQVLEAVEGGIRTPVEIFLADQAREEAVFMGDASLWGYVAELAGGPEPLLRVEGGAPFRLPRRGAAGDRLREQRMETTELGRAVLRGEADRVAAVGIDRWLGGVHLRGQEVPWRWDRASGRLTQVAG